MFELPTGPFLAAAVVLATLQKAGKVRHYGVSNLGLADMQELWKVPGGPAVAANQLLYNLTRRGMTPAAGPQPLEML